MTQKQIVVIEDENDILEVLSYNLKREGFRVTTSMHGVQGLEIVQRTLPDLVLLDLMLPGMDGLEICRRLKGNRKTQNIPIIMVTAKGEESDVVLGLGLGADDYVAKPFSPRELIARVKAVLRRKMAENPQLNNECIVNHGLEIDAGKYKVTLHGREIKFTVAEFRLLYHLASHPGRVFSREQLLDSALGSDAMVVDRNIDVHVRAIRKKTGDEQKFIETIRGIGYRFRDLS